MAAKSRAAARHHRRRRGRLSTETMKPKRCSGGHAESRVEPHAAGDRKRERVRRARASQRHDANARPGPSPFLLPSLIAPHWAFLLCCLGHLLGAVLPSTSHGSVGKRHQPKVPSGRRHRSCHLSVCLSVLSVWSVWGVWSVWSVWSVGLSVWSVGRSVCLSVCVSVSFCPSVCVRRSWSVFVCLCVFLVTPRRPIPKPWLSRPRARSQDCMPGGLFWVGGWSRRSMAPASTCEPMF